MARSVWQDYAAKALRSAGPTRNDKSAALKRAGAEWRAMRHGERHMEENPSGGLLKWALIGGAAYLGYKILTKPAAAAPTPPPLGTTNGTARAQSTTAI